MKRQIRGYILDENSSSEHAICIAKGDYKISNKIDFIVGEFGGEYKEYVDLYNKASYLITAILSFGKDKADENLQKLKDILNNNNIEYTLPKLKVKSLKNNNKTKCYYEIDGYIDYSEETENFINDVLSDSDKLFRFLFGDSMIVTGNYDSYEFDDRMRDSRGEEITEWGILSKLWLFKRGV